MQPRLRIVVFTAGPLVAVNRVFLEGLATDPLLDLRAIIVDQYTRPKRPLALRLVRGLRREGWRWMWFKLRSVLKSRIKNGAAGEESYDALERRTGVQIYFVSDIQSEQSLALTRLLQPQLGVIVGGRILREAIITIPDHGTLNIHKRKLPEYRGGGPVGYWEVLAGESSIGVTIHYAIPEVDAGPLLAEASIPIEECDSLTSLQIKADVLGARLYHDAIRKVALGVHQAIPQDTSRGHTFRSPSELAVWQLEKRLKQKVAKARAALRSRQSPAAGMLVLGRPVDRSVPLDEFVEQVELIRRHHQWLDDIGERPQSEPTDEIAAPMTLAGGGGHDNTWALEYLRYFRIPFHNCVSDTDTRGTLTAKQPPRWALPER